MSLDVCEQCFLESMYQFISAQEEATLSHLENLRKGYSLTEHGDRYLPAISDGTWSNIARQNVSRPRIER